MNKDKSKKTIYDILPNKYKLIVNKIKLDYYIKMNNPDTQKNYCFKFDKLESILLRDSNDTSAYSLLMQIITLESERIDIDQNDIRR